MTVETVISTIKTGLHLTLPLAADRPLLSSGVVDSLCMTDLLLTLERSCGVSVHPSDVVVDNFNTPAQICAFLQEAR